MDIFKIFQNQSVISNKYEMLKSILITLKNDRIISVHFQDKWFNIMVIQVYALTSNAEEAEVKWFMKTYKTF